MLSLITSLIGSALKKPETAKPASQVNLNDPSKKEGFDPSTATNEELTKKVQGDSGGGYDWKQGAAQIFDQLNKENAAREADLQTQRRLSSQESMSRLQLIPGMNDMNATNMMRSRGLSAMAGSSMPKVIR